MYIFILSYIGSTNIYMCEIITMGWRLARGVTQNFARCHPQKCEVSPPKMRGVTPKNTRRHSQKCEASLPKMRGVTPTPARSHLKNGRMAPHQFFKNNYFPEANQLRVLTDHCAWRSYGALPLLKNRRFQLLLFLCYCKCGENARSHPDRC